MGPERKTMWGQKRTVERTLPWTDGWYCTKKGGREFQRELNICYGNDSVRYGWMVASIKNSISRGRGPRSSSNGLQPFGRYHVELALMLPRTPRTQIEIAFLTWKSSFPSLRKSHFRNMKSDLTVPSAVPSSRKMRRYTKFYCDRTEKRVWLFHSNRNIPVAVLLHVSVVAQ